MNFDEIQSYLAARIRAHPQFASVTVLEDDGTYPKSPDRAAALQEGGKGLCITVWQIDGENMMDASVAGASKGEIYVPIVVEENVSVCRAAGGANLKIERAVQHVIEAIVGRPANAVGNQRASLMNKPFENFGKVGGVNTVVVNALFPFFINPIS